MLLGNLPSCLRGLRTHSLELVDRSGLEPSFWHLFLFACLSSSAVFKNVLVWCWRCSGAGPAWQHTPVFLPGEPQGWGSLVGCRLWGRTELDTTEAT